MAASDPAHAPTSSRSWARITLLTLGVVVLTAIVLNTGVERVLTTLRDALPWIPLLLLLDVLYATSEVFAHRSVLGPRAGEIPVISFVRISLSTYCTATLAPLGRAGGEVIRAVGFKAFVGAGRATAAGANMQGSVLIANAIISIPCAIAVARVAGATHALTWLIAANAVGTLFLGSAVWVLSRSRFGARLGRRFPKLKALGAELDEGARATRSELLLATFFATLSRLVQVVQYSVLLLSVGGVVTLSSMLVTMGIHLVGAGFGDMVPSQVGVHEATYRLFADIIGLSDPARAVSIALLARLVSYLVAAVSLAAIPLLTRMESRGVKVS